MQDSSNPLVALMLGLTFCHMACQKFSAKKHSLGKIIPVPVMFFFLLVKSIFTRGDLFQVLVPDKDMTQSVAVPAYFP